MSRSCGLVVSVVVALVMLQTSSAEDKILDCRWIWCPENCKYVIGSHGCPMCFCPVIPIPSCKNVTCAPGYVCELQKVQCFTTPCFPLPTCVPVKDPTPPCPLVLCAPGCRSITGIDGCPTCVCPRCQDFKCKPGYVCELQMINCLTKKPCYPEPVCVIGPETPKPCPLLKCPADCFQDIGPDGCPIGCACPPSCEKVKCHAGYECQLVPFICSRGPCLPKPKCLPIKKPCFPQLCKMLCVYGYKTDENGCQLCECMDKPRS